MAIHASSSYINSIFSSAKRDTGGIGFINDVGGSVDGLMSCTESLGFESSDERRTDDQFGSLDEINELCSRKPTIIRSKRRAEVKNFPPPLSSLSRDGRPTFVLRPVRRDGRLKLTEVRIGRPEILRASRQDGRLKLHLICDSEDDDEVMEEGGIEEENELELIKEEDEKVEKEIFEEELVEEEEEEEGWRFPVDCGGGDGGLRRCHEQVNQHHHHRRRHGHGGGHHHQHDLHVWRQHCVTIR